jgi:hypothetical protein
MAVMRLNPSGPSPADPTVPLGPQVNGAALAEAAALLVALRATGMGDEDALQAMEGAGLGLADVIGALLDEGPTKLMEVSIQRKADPVQDAYFAMARSLDRWLPNPSPAKKQGAHQEKMPEVGSAFAGVREALAARGINPYAFVLEMAAHETWHRGHALARALGLEDYLVLFPNVTRVMLAEPVLAALGAPGPVRLPMRTKCVFPRDGVTIPAGSSLGDVNLMDPGRDHAGGRPTFGGPVTIADLTVDGGAFTAPMGLVVENEARFQGCALAGLSGVTGKNFELVNCTGLQDLEVGAIQWVKVRDCRDLRRVVVGQEPCPSNLLDIRDCPGLEAVEVRSGGKVSLRALSALQAVTLGPDARLEHFYLNGCDRLARVHGAIQADHAGVSSCPSLTGELELRARDIGVGFCRKLAGLQIHGERVSIGSCPSLRTVKLAPSAEDRERPHRATFLEVTDCRKLARLGGELRFDQVRLGGLPVLAQAGDRLVAEALSAQRCPSLTGLPADSMVHGIRSEDCPIPSKGFPDAWPDDWVDEAQDVAAAEGLGWIGHGGEA